MDKKTLKATKGSIKKWKDVAEGKGVDNGPKNCPLCKVFYDGGCVGCPVAGDELECEYCDGTPYELWLEHQDKAHGKHFGPFEVECPECKEIALKEVAFLESLLP